MNVRSCSKVIISFLILSLLFSMVHADTSNYFPTGAGSSTQLTPYGSTYNWQCVDESPPNDATDYVRGTVSASYQLDLYSMSINIPDGSTIVRIGLFVRCRYVQLIFGGMAYGKSAMRIGSTIYYGTENLLYPYWQTYSQYWTTSPATGNAWTESEVENLQIGIALKTTDITRKIPQCTQVYLYVQWNPAPSKTWHNIAQWNFNLTTRQWQTVASWDFNLSTRSWQDLTQWYFNLTTMQWHNLASRNFQLLTRAWKTVSQWNFIINVFGWHSIAHWIFTIGPGSNIPILFVGILSLAVIIMIILYLASKEK